MNSISNSSVIAQTVLTTIGIGFLNLHDSLTCLQCLNINHKIEDIVLACRVRQRGFKLVRFWKILLSRECIIMSPVPNDQESRNEAEPKTNDELLRNQLGEIMRDVVRTFQNHPFFQPGSIGRDMLMRILQSILVAYPSIGYCQGMNFVVANLILARISESITGIDPYETLDPPVAIQEAVKFMPIYISDDEIRSAESDVYDIMSLLIKKDGLLVMSGLWSPDVPKLKLRVYQMDRLIQWTFPKLYNHFKAIQLAPEMLVSQWFLTIFSYTIPSYLTHRLWDFVFFGGWPAMFRVALSILHHLEQLFLSKDLEGIGIMMKDWKIHGKNVDFLKPGVDEEILNRARLMVVTDEILQQLQESFAMEMISISESSLASNQSALLSSPSSKRIGLFLPISFLGRGISDEDDNHKLRSVIASSIGDGINNNWLQRYGDNISEDVAMEMIRVRNDLLEMEKQIDIDKQLIQTKLLKACETYRDIEDQWKDESKLYDDQTAMISKLEEDLRLAIGKAQHVAQCLANHYDQISPSSSAKVAQTVENILKEQKNVELVGLSAVESFMDDGISESTDDRSVISEKELSPVPLDRDRLRPQHYSHMNQMTSFNSSNQESHNSITSSSGNGKLKLHDPTTLSKTASLSSNDLIDLTDSPANRRRYQNKKTSSSSSVPWLGFKAQLKNPTIRSNSTDQKNKHSTVQSVVSKFRSGFGISFKHENLDLSDSQGKEQPYNDSRFKKGDSDQIGTNELTNEAIKTANLSQVSNTRNNQHSSIMSDSESDEEEINLSTESSQKNIDISETNQVLSSEQVPTPSKISKFTFPLTSTMTKMANGLSLSRPSSLNSKNIYSQSNDSSDNTTMKDDSSSNVDRSAKDFSNTEQTRMSSSISTATNFFSETIEHVSNMIQSVNLMPHSTSGTIGSASQDLSINPINDDVFVILAKESQQCQALIVSIHRQLHETKEQHAITRVRLAALKVELDEAAEWKRRLCDQFQLLVEDANRGRKQKLQYLTESYMI